MTERPTTSSGRVKVQITLSPDALEMLEALAGPGRGAVGPRLDDLIRAEYQRQQQGDVVARLARLEALVAALADRAGLGDGEGLRP